MPAAVSGEDGSRRAATRLDSLTNLLSNAEEIEASVQHNSERNLYSRGAATALLLRCSCSMAPLLHSLSSGIAGAVVLTAVHELGRRQFTNAPRMDLVAMGGLRRFVPPLREPRVRSRDLHRVALAGDLVSNSLYYAAVPARTAAATWTRAVVLGALAGIGALVLPEPAGIGKPPHSEAAENRVMTIAWYLAGALATATVATLLRDPYDSRRT